MWTTEDATRRREPVLGFVCPQATLLGHHPPLLPTPGQHGASGQLPVQSPRGSSQQGLNGLSLFAGLMALLWVKARRGFESFHFQIPWCP